MTNKEQLKRLEKELDNELKKKDGFFRKGFDFILSEKFERIMTQNCPKAERKD